MTEIRARMRSFLLVFLSMAVVAIALSALPTAADLHKNQQSEFCLFVDGRELKDERTGDCATDYAAIAGRFLLYFAFFGGALLGPFGLYLMMLAVKTLLTSSGRRRPAPANRAPENDGGAAAGRVGCDSSPMRIAPRSFWIVFAVVAAGAIVLALVPTRIDLDWNRDGELCEVVAERSWYSVSSQLGECVIRPWPLFERFLFWFAIWGGALLGPFALYILLALVMRRR